MLSESTFEKITVSSLSLKSKAKFHILLKSTLCVPPNSLNILLCLDLDCTHSRFKTEKGIKFYKVNIVQKVYDNYHWDFFLSYLMDTPI